jgi:hypothetical protein
MNGSKNHIFVLPESKEKFCKADLPCLKEKIVDRLLQFLSEHFMHCYYINLTYRFIVSRCCSNVEQCYSKDLHFYMSLDFFEEDSIDVWKANLEKGFDKFIRKFEKYDTTLPFYWKQSEVLHCHRCKSCLRFKYLRNRCNYDLYVRNIMDREEETEDCWDSYSSDSN